MGRQSSADPNAYVLRQGRKSTVDHEFTGLLYAYESATAYKFARCWMDSSAFVSCQQLLTGADAWTFPAQGQIGQMLI